MKKFPALCIVPLISLTCGCMMQGGPGATSRASCAPAASSSSSVSPPSAPAPAWWRFAVGLTPEQRDGIAPPPNLNFDNPNLRIFDFAELGNHFYNGDGDTINGIIQKYGTPTKMFGQLDVCGNQWVEIDCPTTTICVMPRGNEKSFPSFSFATDDNFNRIQTQTDTPAPEFLVTSGDKIIPLTVLSVATTNPSSWLPRGLKIGKSTRAQVKAAYPADSARSEESGPDLNGVLFYYIWFKDGDQAFHDGGVEIGELYYEFDRSDVLTSLRVNWFFLFD